MWALGLVIAELILGKAVAAGNGAMDQLSKILRITGRPTVEDTIYYSPFAKTMIMDVKQPEPMSLSEMFPKARLKHWIYCVCCYNLIQNVV